MTACQWLFIIIPYSLGVLLLFLSAVKLRKCKQQKHGFHHFILVAVMGMLMLLFPLLYQCP